nr:putative capsid protein [Cressdnaviricota sp.]
MRRRAYIKVPGPRFQPVTRYPRSPIVQPSPTTIPLTQTKPMRQRTRYGKRTLRGIGGALVGYALRRVYNRYKKRGFETKRVDTASSGSTTSYFKHTQKFHPKASTIKRTGHAQHYHIVVSDRFSNTNYGEQYVKTVDTATFSDLNTMANAIPTIAGTASATKSAVLHDIKSEITFSNMSEATAFLDLYEVVPRSILPSGACAPDTLFENGIIDQGVALGKEVLGLKPTTSVALTSFHKILKHYRIELAQGQSHVHKQSYNMGFKWNFELVNVLGSSYVHPRCTRYLMCIVQGSPCNAAAPNQGQVSTTPIAIDVVRRYRYTWFYNTPTTTNVIYTNAMPTITDGQILDIGAGTPETVNAA